MFEFAQNEKETPLFIVIGILFIVAYCCCEPINANAASPFLYVVVDIHETFDIDASNILFPIFTFAICVPDISSVSNL